MNTKTQFAGDAAATPRLGERSRWGVVPPHPDADNRLLGMILHEIESSGIFIACATSVINYAVRFPHKCQRLLATLPTWLPPKTSVLADERILTGSNVALPMLNRIRDLTTRLGLARKLTSVRCSSIIAGKPTNPLALEELAGLWGMICESTLELLQELQSLVPLGESPAWPGSVGLSSEKLLAAAALGASPCVNDQGAIEIPGWVERRLERRYRIRLDCELSQRGKVWRLHTHNISRAGVGLSGAPAIDVGPRATLAIASMPELPGAIVWRSADSLGFRFDVPLASVADLGSKLLRR